MLLEEEVSEEERKARMSRRFFGVFAVIDIALIAILIYEVVSLFIN